MAKELARITRTMTDEAHLFETLKELSRKEGGAWVFSIHGFSHKTDLIKFQNPSSVPDSFHDLTRNKMAWQGKIRGFTKGARRREQNRGLGRA